MSKKKTTVSKAIRQLKSSLPTDIISNKPVAKKLATVKYTKAVADEVYNKFGAHETAITNLYDHVSIVANDLAKETNGRVTDVKALHNKVQFLENKLEEATKSSKVFIAVAVVSYVICSIAVSTILLNF